jgi:hypothetical protein
MSRSIRLGLLCFSGSVGVVTALYGTYVWLTWMRYGHIVRAASADDWDKLLDRFIPTYEILERHQVRVAAPAEITMAAASEMDLRRSVLIRGIFKSRQLILRGKESPQWGSGRSFILEAKAGGWGVLAEIPGHETVFGAVTQPWVPNVVFRALPADEFASFHEPGYAKIVWTVRVDSISPTESMFKTETRVATTDPVAHRKFRQYWSVFSPGIVLIRRISLRLVKQAAERRAQAGLAPEIDKSRTNMP